MQEKKVAVVTGLETASLLSALSMASVSMPQVALSPSPFRHGKTSKPQKMGAPALTGRRLERLSKQCQKRGK